MSPYGIVVYLHVLSAIVFVLIHGASALASFQARRETAPERLRALMTLSAGTYPMMYGSLALMLLTGVVAGFMGMHWGSGWIWVSIVILILTVGVMSVVVARTYTPLRRALGLPYFEGGKNQPPEAPAPDETIRARAEATTPMLLAVVGVAAVAIILWLMMFKPF